MANLIHGTMGIWMMFRNENTVSFPYPPSLAFADISCCWRLLGDESDKAGMASLCDFGKQPNKLVFFHVRNNNELCYIKKNSHSLFQILLLNHILRHPNKSFKQVFILNSCISFKDRYTLMCHKANQWAFIFLKFIFKYIF